MNGGPSTGRPTSAAGPTSTGRHILADLFGIDAGLLRDATALESLLRGAAQSAGAQLLGSHFHSFGAQDGVTGVVLLAESHISIHTWPECGFAAADIFMCGAADPERALTALLSGLAPAEQRVERAARGMARGIRWRALAATSRLPG